MKTLVVHPFDVSTLFLSEIYSDTDWTVISNNCSKSYLKNQIKQHDRVIMLGHGCEKGLLGFGRLIIDSTYVYLLREKQCIFIWCNANVFVNKYNLKGFNTGMIISELQEAIEYNIKTSKEDIEQSNELFAKSIKESVGFDDILRTIKALYKGNTGVIKFNAENLFNGV